MKRVDLWLKPSPQFPLLTNSNPEISTHFNTLPVSEGFAVSAELNFISTTVLPSLELKSCPPGEPEKALEVNLSIVLPYNDLVPPSLSSPSTLSLQNLS